MIELAETTARVTALAAAHGIKIDPAAVTAALSLRELGFYDGVSNTYADAEMLDLIREEAAAAAAQPAPQATAAGKAKVHPINAHLESTHPVAMLEQCGGLSFDSLSAANRLMLFRNYEATGSIHGKPDAAANLKAELDARGMAALSRGEGAQMGPDGLLQPEAMSPVDRIALARATGQIRPVVNTVKPIYESDIPVVFRGLMGKAKLDALSRVKEADKARAKLEADAAGPKRLSTLERNRLRDTVSMGAGGTVR